MCSRAGGTVVSRLRFVNPFSAVFQWEGAPAGSSAEGGVLDAELTLKGRCVHRQVHQTRNARSKRSADVLSGLYALNPLLTPDVPPIPVPT